MRILILVMTMFLFAVACGTGLSAGEVVEKRYEPEDNDLVPRQSCTTDSDGDLSCHTYYVNEYDDEDWKIKLRVCEVEGKCKTSWVEVPERTHDRLKIGDYFDTKSRRLGYGQRWPAPPSNTEPFRPYNFRDTTFPGQRIPRVR